MLPDALVGAIQRYKEDTDSVAAWLASTAKLCGYRSSPDDIQPPKDDEPKVFGRLKRKTRKEAKNSSSVATKETTVKYTVALKEFVPMAECIATCRKPVIPIPNCFVTTIDRVIRLRSSFGSRMSEHGVDVDAKSDYAHCYFVGVLEKVREVLCPQMPPETSKQARTDPKQHNPPIRYNALPVYEPSQEFLDAPDVERPRITQDDNTVYEAEVEDSLENALTVWNLLTFDADKIRTQIRWAWEGYRDGSFDITAAAIATNVGIQMVRNLASRFISLMEKNGGLLHIALTHFIKLALKSGFSYEQVLSDLYKGVPDCLFSIYDRTFLNALMLIDALIPHTGPSIARMRFELDTPAPDADLERISVKQMAEDQRMATEFWVEGVLFVLHNGHSLTEDEYLHSLEMVIYTGKLSFDMAFASQVLIDIHRLLGEKSVQGFHTLRNHTLHMIKLMDACIDTFAKPEASIYRSPSEGKFALCKDILDSILQDNVPQAKREQVDLHNYVFGRVEEHTALRLSPLLCGTFLFHARAIVFQQAFVTLKETGVVTCMAHLYNASQKEDLVKASWPDMDAFEACFETHDLFIGGKPQNSSDYHKRLLVQLGASVSNFKKGRKVRDSKWIGWDPTGFRFLQSVKGLEEGAPVSRMYGRANFRLQEQIRLTWEELNDIVSHSKYKETKLKDGTSVLGPLSLVEKQQLKKRLLQPKSKRACRESSQSAALLLRSFTLALAAEAREFAFPYLEMFTVSMSVLITMKARCNPLLKEVFGRNYVRAEHLHSMISHITFMANKESGDDRAFREAAAVIQEFASGDAGAIISKRIARIPGFPGPVPELSSTNPKTDIWKEFLLKVAASRVSN
ncbi:hypothetical protein FSARC_11005 [Fusarium sarcochroum]|uniref:DUF6604 domain-containing protein n=1 Tax=Fusarium sarcochroum TaxID=1208366 RepID=A0A8H4X2C0_9HYPO|nr:hypothetical protein FSARC_11005 [Fusarium sarcochroum]